MKTIDMESWTRKTTFQFYQDYDYPQFNICTQINITKTFQYLERQGISKYNAFIWLLSRAANAVRELRWRIRGNKVVEHDRLDPSFTFLTNEKTMAFCKVEYCPDVSEFFNRVDRAIEKTRANPLLEDEPGVDNLLYLSCIPWINFTSISHPIRLDGTESIPRISWGKFSSTKERVSMPVSLQLHHGLADGYHAGIFFEQLETFLDAPEAIDWPTG
jgi:chloramphenicol O-acetyltransferase type A